MQEIWKIEERKSPSQNSKKKSKFENDKQNWNTFLPISRHAAQSYAKLIDTSKHTTGHNMALQRDKNPAPSTRRGTSPCNKETFKRHWSKPTHGGQTQQLRGIMTFQSVERRQKIKQYIKMKRQTNMQQV